MNFSCLKMTHPFKLIYMCGYVFLECFRCTVYVLLYLYDLFHILQSFWLTMDPGNVMLCYVMLCYVMLPFTTLTHLWQWGSGCIDGRKELNVWTVHTTVVLVSFHISILINLLTGYVNYSASYKNVSTNIASTNRWYNWYGAFIHGGIFV
jgi:hypothetical protein